MKKLVAGLVLATSVVMGATSFAQTTPGNTNSTPPAHATAPRATTGSSHAAAHATRTHATHTPAVHPTRGVHARAR